jgi:nitroreductase
MDTYEAIMTRRSVRKFKNSPICDKQIWKYLEAANMAPTASNKQPWEFIVIDRQDLDQIQSMLESSFTERVKYDDEEFRNRIKDLPIPTEDTGGDKVLGLQKFFKSLGGAPVAVLVYIEDSEDAWKDFINMQDASAAVQNLILAAWNDGVGSCWMCGPFIRKSELLKEYFKIPADRKLVALIPLGYPQEVPAAPPKINVRDKTRWFKR